MKFLASIALATFLIIPGACAGEKVKPAPTPTPPTPAPVVVVPPPTVEIDKFCKEKYEGKADCYVNPEKLGFNAWFVDYKHSLEVEKLKKEAAERETALKTELSVTQAALKDTEDKRIAEKARADRLEDLVKKLNEAVFPVPTPTPAPTPAPANGVKPDPVKPDVTKQKHKKACHRYSDHYGKNKDAAYKRCMTHYGI